MISHLFLTALASHAFVAMCGNSSTPSATRTASSSVTTHMDISLEDMWNLFVGSVSVASVNTTVAPTPVPSADLIPPPTLLSGEHFPLKSTNSSLKWPKGFFWGVASAAYQVEGAVKDEGRGPSIWDVMTHRVTNAITNNETADVANNHYYMYKQDIARIAAMGVQTYSFSISWSRVLPFGSVSGGINEQALKHYDDVIDTCLSYNVTPMVTLYHWDTPLALQNKYAGWLSRDIIDDFEAYARIAFNRWKGKVNHWFTINEPDEFCGLYPLPENNFAAVNYKLPGEQQGFVCGHHAILAHAKAYRLAKSIMPNCTVGYKALGGHKIPLTSSAEDAIAVQRAWDFNEGWFANAIFVDGDYPSSLKSYLSFLPEFTTEEKNMIKGSADIFGIDGYTSSFYFAPESGVDACVKNKSHELYPGCFNYTSRYPSGWIIGPSADPSAGWLNKATEWVPGLLAHIQEAWKPRSGIVVSEFGFAEPFEHLKTRKVDIRYDLIRSAYYRDYLQAMLIAVSQGVNVVGCLAWSIMDNFEWSHGFDGRFGLQYVNFTTQERMYKASFYEYTGFIKAYLDE